MKKRNDPEMESTNFTILSKGPGYKGWELLKERFREVKRIVSWVQSGSGSLTTKASGNPGPSGCGGRKDVPGEGLTLAMFGRPTEIRLGWGWLKRKSSPPLKWRKSQVYSLSGIPHSKENEWAITTAKNWINLINIAVGKRHWTYKHSCNVILVR